MKKLFESIVLICFASRMTFREIEGHFPYFTKRFLLNNRKNPRRAKRAGKKNVN